MDFQATSEIRLKNTLEVALVLDNSGSMSEIGTGSGKKRIELLKEASKELVDTLAGQAALMKQVGKPVQFALVPFSASVNVGHRHNARSAAAGWTRTASRRSITRISTGRPSPAPNNGTNAKWSRLATVLLQEGHRLGGPKREPEVTRFTLLRRDMKRTIPTSADTTTANLCQLAGLRRGTALSLQQQRRRRRPRATSRHALRADVRA